TGYNDADFFPWHIKGGTEGCRGITCQGWFKSVERQLWNFFINVKARRGISFAHEFHLPEKNCNVVTKIQIYFIFLENPAQLDYVDMKNK
ncbi:MAG: hypothetical protein LUQ31_06015, partial [Methanoregula sp.]|nr:hypothetical protein [Methanoregula sp.]